MSGDKFLDIIDKLKKDEQPIVSPLFTVGEGLRTLNEKINNNYDLYKDNVKMTEYIDNIVTNMKQLYRVNIDVTTKCKDYVIYEYLFRVSSTVIPEICFTLHMSSVALECSYSGDLEMLLKNACLRVRDCVDSQLLRGV